MANPRAEAENILGGDYEARVLEPSPPAVNTPPFADDPVEPGEVPEGRLLVSPVTHHGDLTWDQVARERPDIGGWCAERWLGAWRPLAPLPDGLGEARQELHRIAAEVVAAERMPENEIALRWTRGGFGTPFFERDGEDTQVRVEGAELVRQRGEDEVRESLEGVDGACALALGDFFGFGCSLLEELRGEEATEDPSLVQLWPEHFDIALDLGVESKGQRATYGFSPGDDDHDEPYLYVSPWAEVSGDLWQANGFEGAELLYSELIEAPDQRRAAFDFMHERLHALGA